MAQLPKATVRLYASGSGVVIDGETRHPVIFTGSANLSKNSSVHNDENILWIEGHTGLAQTYLAEFMRLFEHYRFRAVAAKHTTAAAAPGGQPLRLDATGAQWYQRYFGAPSPRQTERTSFAAG